MPTVAKRRKSTTAKRKPSASKKRKAKVGGASVNATPATITLFGRRYKKSMCGLTKVDATKKATARRAAGKGAAIKKSPGKGYCLYTRG